MYNFSGEGRKEVQARKALTLMIITLVSTIVTPVLAWEYWNTNLSHDGTYCYKGSDNLVQPFGPRVDKINITTYANKTAEYAALERGEIDLIDYPVDSASLSQWTTTPRNQTIAIVDTGPEFGMYNLDMNNNPNPTLPDGSNNPAYIAGIGNPMADVNLRRAMAYCINRTNIIFSHVSGGSLPLLASPLYTPVGEAYGDWSHPEIRPGGALENLTYPFNITKANEILNASGYLPIVGGKRTKGGIPFQLRFVIRMGDPKRKAFGAALSAILTAPVPDGLGLNVAQVFPLEPSIKEIVMIRKDFHLFTGGWVFNADPDCLYYLFNIDYYWYPGWSPNYAYYGGKEAANNNSLVSDYGWGLMTSLNYTQARTYAWKAQEAIADRVQGIPLWASRSFTAFKRTYAGTPGVLDSEDVYEGKPWKGVVNQKGFGTSGWWSQYNMHPVDPVSGQPLARNGDMTMRWGFRDSPTSLNPIYAQWVWDWYVLGRSYDNLIGQHPYTLADMRSLANDWEIGTWDASSLGLGIVTKVTFHLRHDGVWSDGVPVTSSDVKFSLGGLEVPGSIYNLLAARGAPPPYWSSQLAYIRSIATPDPWTVILYLDIMSYFGHHWSGYNIVLPEHVWKPLIENPAYPITDPWNQPNVVSGPYIITDTSDPTARGYIILEANKKHYELDRPINVWTYQLPSTYTLFDEGTFQSVGQMHPLTNEMTADVSVNVTIHSKYFYEINATKEGVYPSTAINGIKNVSLWMWNKVGIPGDIARYSRVSDLLVNEPWAAKFCKSHVETLTLGNLSAGIYILKIEVRISSLEYFDGTSWIVVAPIDNPWYGAEVIYYEWVIVTKLTDVGGTNFKSVDSVEFQPISDLKVDMVDLYIVTNAFGSYPGHVRWNTYADVKTDYKVDMVDLYYVARDFGWVDP